MTKIIKLFPPLRVHLWGGLGSQLFAAHLIIKVQERFPSRRIRVIAHTAGVSRRAIEFKFEKLGVKVVQIEDYKVRTNLRWVTENTFGNLIQIKKILSGTLLATLNWLGLMLKPDTEESFASIRFWTLSLRGHYTKLNLKQSRIQTLYKSLPFDVQSPSDQVDSLVLHYRLGDLLELPNKHPIDVLRVEGCLDGFISTIDSAVLLSDSAIEDVALFLRNSNRLKNFELANHEPYTTLKACINSDQFLGTNAKLSLWAAIFRWFIYGKTSYLPIEFNWVANFGIQSRWY